MKTQIRNWKLQTLPFDENNRQALQQQHYAAQFIALVGKHLIPQQADDSNTNMEYIPEKETLLGNEMPDGYRIGLHLPEMKIIIFGQNQEPLKKISLNGKTRNKVFDELKQGLLSLGVDMSSFKGELHYEIPDHPLAEGAVFEITDKKHFYENAIYRNNAKLVLNEVAENFNNAEHVRIWPHHFDTGSFLPVSYNGQGNLSQSIGLGFAIPDSMINEPYYYLSFWSEKPVEGIENIKPLETGKWMMPGWNGAVLTLSEILKENTAENQHNLVKSFFDYGIEILSNCLKRHSV